MRAFLLVCAFSFGVWQPARAARLLSLTPVEKEPAAGRRALGPAELEALRAAVAADPRDREARFGLVQALRNAGRLEDALAEARAWREKDAYNLVVVRMLGDILAEMGRKADARRVYSAVVELLPGDAQAQRALATVLKQAGDLAGAEARLAAARKLRPDDLRIAFELGDVKNRLGKDDEAAALFESIIAGERAPDALVYPARQRLARIRGTGAASDVKVYLSWDTDRSDVDLWVSSPSGEKIFYSHRNGKNGEALYDDVTTGYGPESFSAPQAQPGAYLVQVNYYASSRSDVSEARGEVLVVLHEGTAEEQRHVLPYRVFRTGQTVTVAKIEVR
jgi:tetratricopeptide (TPR) repeat protein